MVSTRLFYIAAGLSLVVWLGCTVQKADPAQTGKRARRQVHFPDEVDEDVEILAPVAAGQKSSSIKTYRESSVAPNRHQQEFDHREGRSSSGSKSSTSKTTRHQEVEYVEYEEELPEETSGSTKRTTKRVSTSEPEEVEEEVEYEEIGVSGQDTSGGQKSGRRRTTKTQVIEETEGETTEEKIRHLFGTGLVCLDVHDEKTKTTPSFQALVQELTKKYGKAPHIHSTPKPEKSTDGQQDEYDYFVYDQVDELDPITKKVRKVVRRRRVTSIQEYNEFVRRNRKVLKKIKKRPRCTKLGMVPDENDCTKFHECTPSGPVEKDCGPGTIFHEEINACNHPWAVDPKPPCWSPEDDSNNDQLPDDTDPDGTNEPWVPTFPGEGEPVEQIEEPPCKKAGYFELPNECHRGYHCLASKGKVEFNGYINCEATEVFLESESDCVAMSELPEGHKCKPQSSIKEPGPDDSSDEDEITKQNRPPPTTSPGKHDPKPSFQCEKLGKFPHPQKCDTYYTCFISNKKLRSTKHKCAAGTLFDLEHEMCNPQESIKNRPECADHDPKVDWPKSPEDQTENGQVQEPGSDDQTEDGDVVDFDEDEIETYTDDNGVVKRRLKRVKKITYEYEITDPSTRRVVKKRTTIRTRKVTRGEQFAELEKLVKKKVRRVVKRKITTDTTEDGQQTTDDAADPDAPEGPLPEGEDSDEFDKVKAGPPKKGPQTNQTDGHDCTDQLAQVVNLKAERDEAVKNEQSKETIIRTLRKEKEDNLLIIEEKTTLIRDLTNYKESTQELVETLKTERDEAQELVESVRRELEKVKETLNQLKIQKEVDDAELIKLRKQLESCNSRYANLRTVMERTDAALKSCKHELSTLQQCCDTDQNALVKSRKRRSIDGSSTSGGAVTPAKSTFQRIVQDHPTNLEEGNNNMNDVSEDASVADFLSGNQLVDQHEKIGHHQKHHKNNVEENTTKSHHHHHENRDGSTKHNESVHDSPAATSFQQQLPLLIFIFLTLLLVSVVLLGCFVIKKLNTITKLAISSEELETTFHSHQYQKQDQINQQKTTSDKIEKAFNNAHALKGDTHTTKYFAYVDE